METLPVLWSWIGLADLQASREADSGNGHGPLVQTARHIGSKTLFLLSTWGRKRNDAYLHWLQQQLPHALDIHLLAVELPSPTDHSALYLEASCALDEHIRPGIERCYLLSAGTPAMASIWLLLSQSRYPGRLFESSREFGVKEVELPFELSVEFLPQRRVSADKRLLNRVSQSAVDLPAFAGVLHQSEAMRQVIALAHRVAQRSFPVLIQGESGTGKEVLARAIHESGPRKDEPFIAVNCGAIPEGLVESELFGHVKGAFTGATASRPGHFVSAGGGSLFLDEIGELPLSTQVKLLRVIQEREVLPLGGSRTIPIRARILAATHRNLVDEVAAGRFREDLYYRVAVGLLDVPPLRKRSGDLGLLLDHFLELVNRECLDDPDFKTKTMSVEARKLLLQHTWPGNAREMLNAVRRIFLWSEGKAIGAEAVRAAIRIQPIEESISPRAEIPENGIDLRTLLATTAKAYLKQALLQSGGRKVKAAKLLKLPNHQMLGNWLVKYGVRETGK